MPCLYIKWIGMNWCLGGLYRSNPILRSLWWQKRKWWTIQGSHLLQEEEMEWIQLFLQVVQALHHARFTVHPVNQELALIPFPAQVFQGSHFSLLGSISFFWEGMMLIWTWLTFQKWLCEGAVWCALGSHNYEFTIDLRMPISMKAYPSSKCDHIV